MNALTTISDQSEIKNYPAVLALIALAVLAIIVYDRRQAIKRKRILRGEDPRVEAAIRRHPAGKGRS